MQLPRRSFLRAAVLAPIAAAAAPLLGEASTREYVRVAAASFDIHKRQIMYMVNMTVQSPRLVGVLTDIID